LNKKPENSTRDSKIWRIDPEQPDLSLIDKAAHMIKKGGIVIFPTRTLYGIGVDAFNSEAVNRVFQVKQRATRKPLSVLINSIDDVASLAAKIPAATLQLMEIFWPGRLTIVFSARPAVLSNLTGGTGKIGIRIPEHPVAVSLVTSYGRPLTGTSANLSGQPGTHCVDDLPSGIIKGADCVIDSGKLKGGMGSTVVDVTTMPPTIIREGEVSKEELFPYIYDSI